MRLSRDTLHKISQADVQQPDIAQFELNEKIIQFGTGVLLRGLCDYFVDKANRMGMFNGRIVVVKSTAAGDTADFEHQDYLYTVCVRGMDKGSIVKENIICSSISRILSAKTEWQSILAVAENPAVKIVISNTTEVGLQFVPESINQEPPASFPAKLLAFLHHRFKFFNGKKDSRTIVIPTELLSGNGKILKKIIEDLAAYNRLSDDFSRWLQTNVHFCNSLVDRIVTKDPGEETLNQLQQELGYEDKLLTMCEDYRLWAIEGDEWVKSVLSFTAADPGVFVVPDIEIYKSLKLHLLNGTHTFSASLAFLTGFNTVKEAMKDSYFFDFVEGLMLEEIASSIPYQIAEEEKVTFGRKVLDRFSNPFLNHQWLNITLQNTTKMKNRNIPVLHQYMLSHTSPPERMATGFAAFILFMKAVNVESGLYSGIRNGQFYPISDDHAAYFHALWQQQKDVYTLVNTVLGNVSLWGSDLSGYTSFGNLVAEKLNEMLRVGVKSAFNKNVAL